MSRALPTLLRHLIGSLLATLLALGLALVVPVQAAPGLCVGPICGDEIVRSARHPWQLRLRMSDQRGHRERLLVDCRSGSLSPLAGPVERGFAAAVARRACRLATMMDNDAVGPGSTSTDAPR